MEKLFAKFRRLKCRHRPLSKFDHWAHSRWGEGFFVSQCQSCGTEMTYPRGGKWEPVALKDR